jgi:hypothetical protein
MQVHGSGGKYQHEYGEDGKIDYNGKKALAGKGVAGKICEIGKRGAGGERQSP